MKFEHQISNKHQINYWLFSLQYYIYERLDDHGISPILAGLFCVSKPWGTQSAPPPRL